MAYAGDGKGIPKVGLCLDWETSGATWGASEYAKDWQGVSYGAVIFDFENLSPVKTLYREIKYTPVGPHGEKWGWSKEAENIHGLSIEHLAQHGVSQEEAAMDLAELLLEYMGPKPFVPFLGHNRDFDVAFTKQLFSTVGFDFNLHHVHMDTSGLGMLMLGIFKSNDLFDFLALPPREKHNSLEDALMTLEAAKRLRSMVNVTLGIE